MTDGDVCALRGDACQMLAEQPWNAALNAHARKRDKRLA